MDEKPEGELVQLYLLPETDAAPNEISAPKQMVAFAIVLATGKGLTVIVTESDLEQVDPGIASVRK